MLRMLIPAEYRATCDNIQCAGPRLAGARTFSARPPSCPGYGSSISALATDRETLANGSLRFDDLNDGRKNQYSEVVAN